ncbi:MAG: BsuPI-related putative proteinase inhibitor [Bacillota bacterium]
MRYIMIWILLVLLLALPVQAEANLVTLEDDSLLLNMPPRERDGRYYLSLDQLSSVLDWEIAVEECRVEVIGAEESTSFKLGYQEYKGCPLHQAPESESGEIYIGPELTTRLAAEISGVNLTYISWLSLADSELEPDQALEVTVQLWNVSDEDQVLNFNSGQSLELYLRQDDEVAWKLSQGRVYTMALREIELAAYELRSWQETVRLPEELQGSYDLSGEITAAPPLPLNLYEVRINE